MSEIEKTLFDIQREITQKLFDSLAEINQMTMTTPYNKLTRAELKINDVFRSYVIETRVNDNGTITYKTWFGEYTA